MNGYYKQRQKEVEERSKPMEDEKEHEIKTDRELRTLKDRQPLLQSCRQTCHS